MLLLSVGPLCFAPGDSRDSERCQMDKICDVFGLCLMVRFSSTQNSMKCLDISSYFSVTGDICCTVDKAY